MLSGNENLKRTASEAGLDDSNPAPQKKLKYSTNFDDYKEIIAKIPTLEELEKEIDSFIANGKFDLNLVPSENKYDVKKIEHKILDVIIGITKSKLPFSKVTVKNGEKSIEYTKYYKTLLRESAKHASPEMQDLRKRLGLVRLKFLLCELIENNNYYKDNIGKRDFYNDKSLSEFYLDYAELLDFKYINNLFDSFDKKHVFSFLKKFIFLNESSPKFEEELENLKAKAYDYITNWVNEIDAKYEQISNEKAYFEKKFSNEYLIEKFKLFENSNVNNTQFNYERDIYSIKFLNEALNNDPNNKLILMFRAFALYNLRNHRLSPFNYAEPSKYLQLFQLPLTTLESAENNQNTLFNSVSGNIGDPEKIDVKFKEFKAYSFEFFKDFKLYNVFKNNSFLFYEYNQKVIDNFVKIKELGFFEKENNNYNIKIASFLRSIKHYELANEFATKALELDKYNINAAQIKFYSLFENEKYKELYDWLFSDEYKIFDERPDRINFDDNQIKVDSREFFKFYIVISEFRKIVITKLATEWEIKNDLTQKYINCVNNLGCFVANYLWKDDAVNPELNINIAELFAYKALASVLNHNLTQGWCTYNSEIGEIAILKYNLMTKFHNESFKKLYNSDAFAAMCSDGLDFDEFYEIVKSIPKTEHFARMFAFDMFWRSDINNKKYFKNFIKNAILIDPEYAKEICLIAIDAKLEVKELAAKYLIKFSDNIIKMDEQNLPFNSQFKSLQVRAMEAWATNLSTKGIGNLMFVDGKMIPSYRTILGSMNLTNYRERSMKKGDVRINEY